MQFIDQYRYKEARMIGIWPEAWLRLHERERTLDLARRRAITASTVAATTAPAASGTIGATVVRTPDLACC